MLQRHFNCSAVALWRIHGVNGERKMACLGRYRASGESLPCRAVLSEARLSSYFAALDDRGVYVCVDTGKARDFVTADDPRRRPDPPRAFVDALVSINGRPFGMLTCYQETGLRHWAVDEVTKLRRLGARVASHLSRMTPTVFGVDCQTHANRLES